LKFNDAAKLTRPAAAPLALFLLVKLGGEAFMPVKLVLH
jgi:hypothetical protein